MKSILTFILIFIGSKLAFSQTFEPDIRAVANHIVSMTRQLSKEFSGDRAFTLHPDTIIVSNFENGGQTRKITYYLNYEEDLIKSIDFEIFHSTQGITRIYYDYTTNDDLFQARFYSIVGGNEVYIGKVHYNYNSSGTLISFIDYDKDNLIAQGDSVLFVYNGSQISNYTHFTYNTFLLKWEQERNISQILYTNGNIKGYQLSEYYSLDDVLYENRYKYENTSFIPGSQDRIFVKVNPFYLYDSTYLATSVLSPQDAAVNLITGPSGFDKYYFNNNTQQYSLSEKAKLSFVNNNYVSTIYDVTDTSIVFGTRTYTYDGQSRLINSFFMSTGGSEEYSFQYNIHNRIGQAVYKFLNNIKSTKTLSYNVNSDGQLKEYVNEDVDAIFGSFRDQYYFGYKEIVLASDDVKKLLLSVYPNPAQSYFELKYSELKDPAHAQILLINAVGEVVRNYNLGSKIGRYDIGELKSGIYLIRLIDGNKINTVKLIKLN